MHLKYDGTFNFGHVMTVVAFLASAIGAVVFVQFDLRRLSAEQMRIEASFSSEIGSIRSEAAAREGRLRQAELTLAGQASDLRSIQATLTRIERLLEASRE